MIVGAVNAVVDYLVQCWKVWYVLWQANQRFCPNMTINLIYSVASILSEYPSVIFFFVWWLHQLISNLPFITVEKTHCPHDTWNRCVNIFCISYVLALLHFIYILVTVAVLFREFADQESLSPALDIGYMQQPCTCPSTVIALWWEVKIIYVT